MKANFDACMAEVFKYEGGYVNDQHDPGGETNLGISSLTSTTTLILATTYMK